MKKIAISVLLACLFAAIALPTFTPSPTVNAQTPVSVSLTPSSYTESQINQTFEISLSISNVQNLWGWTANITWDPEYLSFVLGSEGSFMTGQLGSGNTAFMSLKVGANEATVQDASFSSQAASGSGVIANLEFEAIKRTSSTTINSTIELLGPVPSGSSTTALNPQIALSPDTSQATIAIKTNSPPTAIAGPNQTVPKGAPVVLNGTQSSYEGTNPTFTWTFTDVTPKTLTGEVVYYTFNNPGTYVVTLTVSDSIGNGTAETVITVTNQTYTPPVILVSGIRSIFQPITFQVENSTLRDTPIQKCVWNMGNNLTNGLSIITTTTPEETYTYSQNGTYNVTLTIYYTDGSSDFSNATVTIGASSSTSTTNSNPNLSNSPTPDTTSTDSGTITNGSLSSLPATVLGILLVITVFILGGSVLWLRKRV